MSVWNEGLRKIVDFHLIDPNFDGTRQLFTFYRTGKYSLGTEKDMNKVRKDSDKKSAIEDIIFLNSRSSTL
ncbi:MAG TPA: hypothetical protein VKC53_00690 [Patescibacteria group bacterium]|nr:hypothetical protein [Patescibacteria group bacterium]